MITQEHLEGAGLLILTVVAFGVLFVVAVFVWEWLGEVIHVRGARSKWETAGDAGDRHYAIGAAIASGRWLCSLWIRGGWRIVISRDRGGRMDPHFGRLLAMSNALSATDIKLWTEAHEKTEEQA